MTLLITTKRPSPRRDLSKVTGWRVAGVLAGAYRGRDISKRALLTHLVGDLNGQDIVLCRRVPPESMADEYSDPGAALTCPECIKRWARLQSSK